MTFISVTSSSNTDFLGKCVLSLFLTRCIHTAPRNFNYQELENKKSSTIIVTPFVQMLHEEMSTGHAIPDVKLSSFYFCVLDNAALRIQPLSIHSAGDLRDPHLSSQTSIIQHTHCHLSAPVICLHHDPYLRSFLSPCSVPSLPPVFR